MCPILTLTKRGVSIESVTSQLPSSKAIKKYLAMRKPSKTAHEIKWSFDDSAVWLGTFYASAEEF
jgi:hypothetical protein